jgi:hypothetical protein
MTNQKSLIILVISLVSVNLMASSYEYSGVDGDGSPCRFSYNTTRNQGVLQMGSFAFRPIGMKFYHNFQQNYYGVIAGKIPFSDYSIVAEGTSGDDLFSSLNSLNLVTVIESHQDHAHVWFCHSLIQQNQL